MNRNSTFKIVKTESEKFQNEHLIKMRLNISLLF
jgi:hypothetical protein